MTQEQKGRDCKQIYQNYQTNKKVFQKRKQKKGNGPADADFGVRIVSPLHILRHDT